MKPTGGSSLAHPPSSFVRSEVPGEGFLPPGTSDGVADGRERGNAAVLVGIPAR